MADIQANMFVCMKSYIMLIRKMIVRFRLVKTFSERFVVLLASFNCMKKLLIE